CLQCRLVVYALLGLGSLLVGGLPLPCPPTCQCYDTSKVSGNPLAAVSPEVLAGLPSLSKLSLGANAIRSLQPGLFTTTYHLQDLCLPGNKIEALPPNIFHPLQRLQTLDLSQNLLTELPDGLLAPLAALHLLKLSDNLLAQVCPGAFKALGRLAELHLDGNRLEELPVGAFAGLGGLQRLQLQHNALVNLPPDIFTSLPNLTVLSLEGNRLATLPAALFTSTPHLLYLSLARNHLPAGLLAGLPLLTTLALLVHVLLANNPWACDCGLAYLLGWLQTFAEPLIHAQASCASPAALQGRSLLEVPQGDPAAAWRYPQGTALLWGVQGWASAADCPARGTGCGAGGWAPAQSCAPADPPPTLAGLGLQPLNLLQRGSGTHGDGAQSPSSTVRPGDAHVCACTCVCVCVCVCSWVRACVCMCEAHAQQAEARSCGVVFPHHLPAAGTWDLLGWAELGEPCLQLANL
uniref:Carboxypeptidase N subunit 2 n=1 Tax=Otus sunia TaxID=257818 RepID=A0A8C8E7R8_9STRI